MTTTTTEPTETGTCALCGKPSETIFHGHCANRPIVFHNLAAAWNYAWTSRPPFTVVMGDCPEYWVVTRRAAGWLLGAGYELAPKP